MNILLVSAWRGHHKKEKSHAFRTLVNEALRDISGCRITHVSHQGLREYIFAQQQTGVSHLPTFPRVFFHGISPRYTQASILITP